MRPLLLVSACITLLASCAPSMTAPVTGRIVNTMTGVEGTVQFTRGTLQPRLEGPNAPENATLQIAGQTYTGRTVIINSGVSANPGWGASFNLFGGHTSRDSGFGWYTRFGTPSEQKTVTRTGNLIARTSSTPTLTMTCTLSVDVNEHGVGDCTGSDGTRYALQF